MEHQNTLFDIPINNQSKVTNVSSIPQRSPFRYPGGKTWLIPVVRKWLKQEKCVRELIEPFAGGGIVSLTAAFENLAKHITMLEIDEDVAAAWQVILSDHNSQLSNRIATFDLTRENILNELNKLNKSLDDIAFCTILKNRVFHGGILAKGSGLLKNGENGKGISSRWYPKTLRDRILAINSVRSKIQFIKGDAYKYLNDQSECHDCYYFIDPPYTKAGKRLYTHYEVDHRELFNLVSMLAGKYMLTYDDSEEIRSLASEFNLPFKTIEMKTTHHLMKQEIIISDNFSWWLP